MSAHVRSTISRFQDNPTILGLLKVVPDTIFRFETNLCTTLLALFPPVCNNQGEWPSISALLLRMPRGYYLAQGLYPLGERSSDDEEGPCELPDGRLVCGPHGLVICGKCCKDYSFMDDILSDTGMDEDEEDGEEDEEDEEGEDGYLNRSITQDHVIPGREKRRGTGQVIPTKFDPPGSIRPTDLFRSRRIYAGLSR